VGDVGHVVHIERLGGHGVRVWLDGVPVRKLVGWSLVEELRPPSTLTFTVKTDAIVWGAPAEPEHYCDPGRDSPQDPVRQERLPGLR
jgi:hypothetical protein